MAQTRPRGRPITESELKALIAIEIEQGKTYDSGQIESERRENLEYYYSDPIGNEVDGRSQVVTSDVQDVVESTMPDLMELFSGDEMVRYEPVSQEDEPFAAQATDMANYAVYQDNPGFVIVHDWMKDALIQKLGALKVTWDDAPIKRQTTYSGVDDVVRAEWEAKASAEPERVKITEFDEEDEGTYALTVETIDDTGRIRLQNVPPERFGTSRRAKDLDSCRMLFQEDRKYFSELLEMGFKKSDLESLEEDEDFEYDQEELARWKDEEIGAKTGAVGDPALKSITFFEAYPLLDYDGNGIAERHLVYVAGSGYKILPHPETGRLATKVDDHPFVALTPIKMPHRLIGRALADLVKPIQAIKTTVVRQGLDNMYHANNQRLAVVKEAASEETLDDLLNNAVGAHVRTRRAGALEPIPHLSILNDVLGHIEYWDTALETRTGVMRSGQGLDPEHQNKTATGIQALIGRGQRRTMMIARVFAETGYRDLFRKMLRLMVNHQNKPRTIRLRNQWVEMDPRSWNADMDVTVDVGIGFGTKEIQVQHDMALLNAMAQGVPLQAAANEFMFLPENFYNVYKRIAKNNGWRNPDEAVTDPASEKAMAYAQKLEQMRAQQAQSRPDPKMMEARARIEMEQMKTKATLEKDRAQAQSEMQKDAAQAQAETEKDHMMAQAQSEREMIKVQTDSRKTEAEIALAQWKAEQEMEIKRWEAEQRIEIERQKAEAAAAVMSQKASDDADIKRQAAKSNGSDRKT